MPLPSAPFNAADSIINGLSVLQFKPANTSKTGTTIAITTGLSTAVGHGMKVNQQFILVSLTGGTGLTAGNSYWVLTAPTADTFTFAATRGGTVVAPTVAATAFVVQPVHIFELAKITGKGTLEEKTLERPDAKGVMWPVRTWVSKAGEEWTTETEEVKRALLLFNGCLRGRVVGTATRWVPDIDDASGKCALVSESDFPCTMTSDGDINDGGGEASKMGLKFKSNKLGFTTYTSDATV
jgi:hypothetical protein